ncbi:hypothetical protein [Legionella sp.]|uniref:hypothetical protein n=1 Tax=Legionella sp. TaxID=459 RepID=UPI003D0EC050
MPYNSSLLDYLDANLPNSGTIIIWNYLSKIAYINRFVSPEDETISELRNKVDQAKKDTTNFEYLIYYKMNVHYLTSRLNLIKEQFSYSETETNMIKRSTNVSNTDHKLTDLQQEMGGEIEKFLPEVKKDATHKSMDEQGKSALALASNSSYNLFQPHRLLTALLTSVVHGNQDNAEKILKRYPELLMQRGTVTDYSGRTFTNITAFQCALWALDTRYMCTMMLDCLSKNEQAEELRIELLNQFNEHEVKGVCYMLEGKTYQEKHYNFSLLITTLQTYIDNFTYWIDNDQKDLMATHWSTQIGGAQRYVPAHVAQHYCDPDESFNSMSSFTKPRFKRTLTFYNPITFQKSSWFSSFTLDAGLGVDFAVLRFRWLNEAMALDKTLVSTRNFGEDAGVVNLNVLTSLFKVRTDDLVLLRERLENPIYVHEENPEISPAGRP